MNDIRIHVEPSVNDPQTCKFVVDRSLHNGEPFWCDSEEKSQRAPLAQRLFALNDITQILIDQSVITITKKRESQWPQLAATVGQVIRNHLQSGERAVSDVAPQSDAEIAVAVQKLLERDVNPAVASHGGEIGLVEVKDRKVYLKMSGGCQGCGSAKLTLSLGVQNSIREAIPSVLAVIDVTDHDAGTAPYYAKTDASHQVHM